MDEPLIDSSAASPAEPVEEYRVINGWLVVAAGVCTCSGLDGTRHEVGCGWEPIRLVEDLLADGALAAADRENAELRAAILRNVDTHADLSTQLAAAQAQLAEANSDFAKVFGKAVDANNRANAAEARLEAVRALADEAFATRQCHVRDECEMHTMVPAVKLRAALSAAPQPEPALVDCRVLPNAECVHEECRPDDEPPARPTAECRHCNGSGNAHTFDGDELGICGTCHGTGSATGGGL